VQELNPLTTVEADTRPVASFMDEQLRAFQVVVLTDVEARVQVAVAEACHRVGVPVLAASLMGWWGFFFSDAGTAHKYSVPQQVPNPPRLGVTSHVALSVAMATPWAGLSTKETRPSAFAYMAMLHAARDGALPPVGAEAVAVAAVITAYAERLCDASGAAKEGRVNRSVIEDMARGFGHPLTAVGTILGGVLCNEVLKLITGAEEPVCNLYALDTMTGLGGNINVFQGPPQ